MSIQTSRRTLLKTIPVVTAGAVSSPVLAVEPERGSGKHWAMLIDLEGEENFVGDSEIIALGGASNETKDRPLG